MTQSLSALSSSSASVFWADSRSADDCALAAVGGREGQLLKTGFCFEATATQPSHRKIHCATDRLPWQHSIPRICNFSSIIVQLLTQSCPLVTKVFVKKYPPVTKLIAQSIHTRFTVRMMTIMVTVMIKFRNW